MLAIAVLLAWAASLGWLGVRHFHESDSQAALSGEASLRIAPGDAWLAIMVGDVQVGTAGVTLDTLSPGFRVNESVTLELPVGNELVHSARFTQITVGPTLTLQKLTSTWSRPPRRTGYALAPSDDSLVAHYEPLPPRRFFHSVVSPGLLHIFPYQLAISRGMTRGRELTQLLLEGWPATARMSRITIGGDTVVTYPDSVVKNGAQGAWQTVTTLSSGGVMMTVDGVTGPYRIISDKRGRLQGLETLFGVRWVRRNFDLAMAAFQDSLPLTRPRILATWPRVAALAGQPVTRDSAIERRYLLSHRDGTPIDPALRDLLAGGRQRVAGDTLIIVASGAPQPPVVVERDTDLRLVDPLQNLSGAIRGRAAATVPDPRAPGAVADLVAYLGATIMVDTAAAAPQDAQETFAAGRGRPDGVTRLFVAMAQSVNMTARYVIGIAARGDTLYTHPWAEVRNSRGEWLAVDPVRGQVDASPELIRLGWGGSTYPEDMLALIANARIVPLPSGRAP